MTRTLNPKPPQVNWAALLQTALFQAIQRRDPRLAALQKAQREGTAEATLRKFGIISENDLLREFPTT